MSADQFFNAQPPFYSPLLLRAPILAVGESLAVGAMASPPAVALRNPNRTAMLIDQIRFATRPGPNFQQIRSSQTRVNIMLGNIPLTKDFISILALCPSYNLVPKPGYDSDVQTAYVWHLPRPIYCPPDVALSVQFKQFTFTRSGVLPRGPDFLGPLELSIAGRSLPSAFPVPPEIFVPWATQTHCGDTDVTSFVSADHDLVNTFDQALKITSFVGSLPAWNYNLPTEPQPGALNRIGVYASPVTARMSLSSGKMLVRDRVPFYNLFTPSRRHLDIDGILQAKEFVRLFVDAPDGFTIPVDPLQQASAGLADLAVGMIGYRVLKTPQGSWT